MKRRAERRFKREMKRNPNLDVSLQFKVVDGVYMATVTTSQTIGDISASISKSYTGKARKNTKKRWTNMRGFVIYGSGKDNGASVAPYSTKDPLGSFNLEDFELLSSSLTKSMKFKKAGPKSVQDAKGVIFKATIASLPSFIPADMTITNNHGGTGEGKYTNNQGLIPKKRTRGDTSIVTWPSGNFKVNVRRGKIKVYSEPHTDEEKTEYNNLPNK